MTDPRQFSPTDRFLTEISQAINVLAAPARAARPYPAGGAATEQLSGAERAEAARLMRVNHAGEVAAQALYHGQALRAREPVIAAALQRAATEEMDHLAWCQQRLKELGGRPSLLDPLWYAGSYLIGVLAGAAGDPSSLGFITETERQVEAHLGGHLQRLPAADQRSRQVLKAMAEDEAAHGAHAQELGGQSLPEPVRIAMKWTARLMTSCSFWL